MHQRPLRLLTATALGLGTFSLLALGLGLLGHLNHATTFAIPIASIAGWVFSVRKHLAGKAFLFGSLRAWLKHSAGWSTLWLVAVPALALTATAASIMPGVLWKHGDPHPYDVLAYHLQIPRQWHEAQQISLLKENSFSCFPMNQEMHYLQLMHLFRSPWRAMYACQFLSMILMALTALGTRALVLMKCKNSGAAHAAGVLVVGAPWIAMLGSTAYIESGLLFFGVLAGAWALNAIDSTHTPFRRFLLGGVMAGLAAGVKYTGVPAILLAIPLAALCAITKVRLRRTLVGCAIFSLTGLAVFAPWMIRNMAWTGNPIFPLAMHILGQGHFTDQQVDRFLVAHTPPPSLLTGPARLATYCSSVLGQWQFGFVLIPLAIAGVLSAGRRPAVRFLATVFAVQTIIWIGFTHLQPRFFTPVIPFAAALVALAIHKRRYARPLVLIVSLSALVGFVPLHLEFERYLNGPEQIRYFFGNDDLKFCVPRQLATLIDHPETKIALIGNAEPFFIPVAAAQITYRSVFDVVIPQGSNCIDAWLGQSVIELRKDHLVEISLPELKRLSETYTHIPAPRIVQGWNVDEDGYIFLAPDNRAAKGAASRPAN